MNLDSIRANIEIPKFPIYTISQFVLLSVARGHRAFQRDQHFGSFAHS